MTALKSARAPACGTGRAGTLAGKARWTTLSVWRVFPLQTRCSTCWSRSRQDICRRPKHRAETVCPSSGGAGRIQGGAVSAKPWRQPRCDPLLHIQRILYESLPYHSCVFVGLDPNGVPRYAALRSTCDGPNAFKENRREATNGIPFASHQR